MSVVVRRIIFNRETVASSWWVKKQISSLFAVLAFFGAVLLAIHPGMLWAAKVSDLYRAEVPIDSQSDREQQEAMGKALADVLVKVTGETRSLANSQLKGAIKQPEKYVKGYSYRRESTHSQQQYLQVAFVEESVNRLLREAGLAIWGANRPTTLTWLAIDDGSGRKIQRGVASDPLVSSLEQRFVQRSLPLIFPLMDFDDSQALSPVDVWGLFTDKLTQASQRYGADAILAGRLAISNGIYNGRLSLVFRGQRQDAEITGLNHEQLSLVAADLVGSTLSRHYAVASLDSRENTVLVVEQVNSVKQYSELLTYLENLTAVRSVDVRRLSGAVVELELSIDGYSSQLTDAIALGRRLQVVKKNEGLNIDVTPKLYYRWIQR